VEGRRQRGRGKVEAWNNPVDFSDLGKEEKRRGKNKQRRKKKKNPCRSAVKEDPTVPVD